MKSIRTRIIWVFSICILVMGIMMLVISMAGINLINQRDSNELLEHLGRESSNEINGTLENTEHSVNNIYYYANDQLESLFGKLYGKSFREEYLERVSLLALSEANGSDYVKCVYYRLTTDIKDKPNGFQYQWNEDKGAFAETTQIDLTKYDQDDIEHVGWYYLPKKEKEAMWIGPYYSEELGIRVISYVAPVYVYGRFTSVVGMDIDIDALCRELEGVTVYDTGSALLFDQDGNILYGKEYKDGMEKASFKSEEKALYSAMKKGLDTKKAVEYAAKKGKKKLYACELVNGMTLCVTAPVREINAMSMRLLSYSTFAGILLMVVALFVMIVLINSFLRPLKELTAASKQLADGNLDVHLHYSGSDEVGQLSETFGIMANSLKRYFDHFHSLAYTDSLTGLNNKAAYTITKEVIESELKMGRANFTIIVMDVNNLKKINDSIGHEKGDLLLQHVTVCLRKALVGFPVYRIGGDEFCSIINDSSSAGDLIERLQGITADMSRKDMELFGCNYQIAAGAATYEKGKDHSFDEVFNRADQAMYENKKYLKSKEKEK